MNNPQRIPAAALAASAWDEDHQIEAFTLLEERVVKKCLRVLNDTFLAEEAALEALIRVFKYYDPDRGPQKLAPEVRLLVYAGMLARHAAIQLGLKEEHQKKIVDRVRSAYEAERGQRRDPNGSDNDAEEDEKIYFDPAVEDRARRAAAMATFADQAEAVLRQPDPGPLPEYVEEQVQLCLISWREFHFASGLDVEALARRGLALAASLCKPRKGQEPCTMIFRCFAARWRLAGSPKPWKEVAALILAETGEIISPNSALVRVKRLGERMKQILLRS